MSSAFLRPFSVFLISLMSLIPAYAAIPDWQEKVKSLLWIAIPMVVFVGLFLILEARRNRQVKDSKLNQ